MILFFFFQAEDGIRDGHVTGVQTCALPIYPRTQLDDMATLARGLDPSPHLLARRRAWCVVRSTGRVLQPLLELGIFVLVHHLTHSPAKSANATRSFARARDSCAFDVPVSTPNAAPISSCV